jgi:hypothetical protein
MINIILPWTLVAVLIFGALYFVITYQKRKDEEMAIAVQMVMDHAFVLMDLEEVEGKLMAYRTKTQEFIVQGDTFEDLAKEFLKMHPGKTGLFPKNKHLRIESEDAV